MDTTTPEENYRENSPASLLVKLGLFDVVPDNYFESVGFLREKEILVNYGIKIIYKNRPDETVIQVLRETVEGKNSLNMVTYFDAKGSISKHELIFGNDKGSILLQTNSNGIVVDARYDTLINEPDDIEWEVMDEELSNEWLDKKVDILKYIKKSATLPVNEHDGYSLWKPVDDEIKNDLLDCLTF